MTRLGASLLLQLVDDQLVLMDESTGAEVTAPATLETLMHAIDDVAVARADGSPARYEFHGVRVPEPLLDRFLQAMGYLVSQAVA